MVKRTGTGIEDRFYCRRDEIVRLFSRGELRYWETMKIQLKTYELRASRKLYRP